MDPRARIEAFLAGYAAAHAEVKPLFDNKEKGTSLAAFDAWREKLREIDVAHRNGEFYRQYALSFGSSPEFSPDAVEIEKIEVYGQHGEGEARTRLPCLWGPHDRDDAGSRRRRLADRHH